MLHYIERELPFALTHLWHYPTHEFASTSSIHATHTQFILVFGWDRPFATIRWALQHLIHFKSMTIKCVSQTTVKLQ